MPIHDWTRVPDGIFHAFHEFWIAELATVLNDGVLPSGYYALPDQYAAGPIPDVVALRRPDSSTHSGSSGGIALQVAQRPPRVAYLELGERDLYVERAERLAIHHTSGDIVVAYVEVVSPGNKHSRLATETFCRKIGKSLEAGCHVLVVDLHSSGKHDPRGLHALFWEDRYGEAHGTSAEHPLGLAAYRSVWTDSLFQPQAYFEPINRSHDLPEMPLFLAEDEYVNVPLALSYNSAWRRMPPRWRDVLEEPPANTPSHISTHHAAS